jgi:hypothetical protein
LYVLFRSITISDFPVSLFFVCDVLQMGLMSSKQLLAGDTGGECGNSCVSGTILCDFAAGVIAVFFYHHSWHRFCLCDTTVHSSGGTFMIRKLFRTERKYAITSESIYSTAHSSRTSPRFCKIAYRCYLI